MNRDQIYVDAAVKKFIINKKLNINIVAEPTPRWSRENNERILNTFSRFIIYRPWGSVKGLQVAVALLDIMINHPITSFYSFLLMRFISKGVSLHEKAIQFAATNY